MKKIGLLSFPTAVNQGAYLQIYALKSKTEELGCEVRVLNYRNRTHYLNELKSLFVKKNPIEIYNNLKRFITFRKAQKRLGMRNLTFDVSKLKTNDLDVVSIGADIVWNYGTPFLGHDPIYFGNALESERVISYAPSMGDSEEQKLPLYVKANINNFSHRSARDNNTKSIVNSLGLDCELVLDPTLIIDWSKHEIETYKYNFKYLLVYAFTFTEEDVDALVKYARDKNLKIVSMCFNKKLKWCDINLMNIDPLEFLYIYKKAEFVFTSTFHGLLFSLKYKRQFLLRDNKTVHNKVVTLVSLLGLQNNVLDGDVTVSEIFDRISVGIDYEKVNLILDLLIEDSIKYYSEAIHD
jgi:hypothetical protein